MSHSNRDELDTDLKDMLEAYGEADPQRDPASEKRTKDRFMSELNTMFGTAPASQQFSRSPRAILMAWTSGLRQAKENAAMSLSRRSSMTLVASFLVVAVILFGSGFTAYAAGGALPGDALYPIKTSLENARASLTTDNAEKSSLYLGFAGLRLDEIKSLIAQGRFDQVPQTASLFEKDIERAQEAIRHLGEDNPARAAVLNTEATDILRGYDDALKAMLSSAPLDVQPVIQGAIDISSSASNDMDNANTNTNEDNGNDINSNANTNEDNGNDINSNANTNEDNGNDINSNANTNGTDDNSNSINSNTNDNMNGNMNTNTNTNSNDGSGGSGSGGSGGGDGGGGGGGGGGDGGGGG